MKITPLGNNIQLEILEAKAGILDTSSRHSAVEFAKVLSISKEVTTSKTVVQSLNRPNWDIKVGDHVFVKAWAIDIINHEDKKYYFCNLDTNGILAVVK